MRISKLLFLVFLMVLNQVYNCELKDVNRDIRELEHPRIIEAADAYLKEDPVTITSVTCSRSAGGVHDFYSEGDYWWPDPDNPDGPYIRRDGYSNPDNFQKHREFLMRFSIQVPALVAAYVLTSDTKYSEKALHHLRSWFIDETTRMNPNLMYAQAIKGRVTGRGIGIIDTIHLVEIARAIGVLEKYQVISTEDLETIRNWFEEYVHWLTTHKYGIDERDNGNNHSTCWNLQVATYATLVNDQKLLQFCRDFFRDHLLPEQTALDGSFPREIRRTKPYAYSLFNLDMMAANCEILSTEEENLWEFSLSDGRSIKKAIQFMVLYVQDKSLWPHQPDVMYFDKWPVAHTFLLFAGIVYDEPEYINLWKRLEHNPETMEVLRNLPIRQPVLWLK